MLAPLAVDALFHTPAGIAFADLMVDGHRETWPIRSKRFRTWLRRRYYQKTGSALSAPAISSALDMLEAQAQFDAPERSVHVRVAEHAGQIYLDLNDENWRAVEIGSGGWRVIGSPPVRFRRPAGMLPLPEPEPGGSIETLDSFLNLPRRSDFVLVVAWLLATLRSRGPYPVFAISGEQGSAKTVLSKVLKDLIDPNAAPVRALSREERELMIAANNGYLLAFDNVSGLPVWLSDALCRLASGGSFSVRQLYTDDEEMLFQAARPILLNGIEEVVSRPDFARWATACETAFWPAGTFARAYAANRRAAIESTIEADPIASCVRTIMANRAMWTGSASDLLRLCVETARDEFSRGASGTKSPRALAGRLRRTQTFLRVLGIEITFWREGRMGTRMIRLSASAEDNVSTVSSVGTSCSNGSGANPPLLGFETR
jgi:hypothetical protein